MSTIRMSRARKQELRIHTAIGGRRIVQDAITQHFNKQYAEEKIEDYRKGKSPMSGYQSGYQADVVWETGLKLTPHSIERGRVPNVNFRGKREGRSYYSNNYQINNSYATAENGTKIYKYAWEGTEEEAIKQYAINELTKIVIYADQINNGDLDKDQFRQAYRTIEHIKMYLEKMLYWLGLESLSDVKTIVSKRASPYEDAHYVLRSNKHYKDSDFNSHYLLGITGTGGTRSLIRSALPSIQTFMDAVTKQSRTANDISWNTRQLKDTQTSLERTKVAHDDLVSAVTKDGAITLDKAMEVDSHVRQEVTEYFADIPHNHVLTNAQVKPVFKYSKLSTRIQQLVMSQSNLEVKVAQWTLKVQESESGLANMEVTVASLKLANLLKNKGITVPEPTTDSDSQ